MVRKRILTLVLASLCAICLLVGCGTQQESSTNSPTTSGPTTMADYMSDRYASFDEFDKGIQTQQSIPPTLELFADGGTIGRISDPSIITKTWNALKEVRIDTSKPAQMECADTDVISFMFDSGRELCSFPFCTTSYTNFSEDARFPVENPSEVQEVFDSLLAPASESLPKEGSALQEQNGAYFWDANGDGTLEHMWFDFNDNGDEAPSNMSVRVFGGNIDASSYLDRAYTITSVTLEKDDKGPYVIVGYETGDYYGHDTQTTSTIRLVGTNELEIQNFDTSKDTTANPQD